MVKFSQFYRLNETIRNVKVLWVNSEFVKPLIEVDTVIISKFYDVIDWHRGCIGHVMNRSFWHLKKVFVNSSFLYIGFILEKVKNR